MTFCLKCVFVLNLEIKTTWFDGLLYNAGILIKFKCCLNVQMLFGATLFTIYVLPPYSEVATKKERCNHFFVAFMWSCFCSYQRLQQLFFQRNWFLTKINGLSSSVLTSDLCCSSLWCDCSIVTSKPRSAPDIFSHLEQVSGLMPLFIIPTPGYSEIFPV